jgi:hypothetical protein
MAVGATNTNKRLALMYDTTLNIGLVQAMIYGTGTSPLCLNAAGGNVGIGKTNPGVALDVTGTVTATALTGAGAGITALDMANAGSGTLAVARGGTGTTTSTGTGSVVLSNAPTLTGIPTINDGLYIYQSTGTSVSATSGSVVIDHGNSGGASSILFPSRVNYGSDYAFIQYQDASTPGGAGESARFRIGTQNDTDDHIILEPSGNVGVKVATPSSYTLQVAGTIGSTGDITAFTSDERLKTKTGTLTDALDKVCTLDTFTYTHSELARSFGFTDNRQYVGISAQQIQKVLPETVRRAPFDSDTINGVEQSKSGQDYLTVQYERIVPLLIEALKEERKAREALEQRIKFLEQK